MGHLLVTGGAGLIGANFVHHVLAHTDHTDHTVTVLGKLTYAGNRENLAGAEPARCALAVGDVADAVVHFAAESHNGNSLRDPEPFLHTNVVGTYTLLEAARRHGTRFHHVSTDEVFGGPGPGGSPALHGADCLPAVQPVLGHQGGVGPPGARVGALVRAARDAVQLLGQPRALPARGEVHPPPDHERAHGPAAPAVRRGGERAGLDPRGGPLGGRPSDSGARDTGAHVPGRRGRGTGNPTVLREILRLMGRPEDAFDRVPGRAGHDRRYAIDGSRTRRELGGRPHSTDFTAGLADTIAWYPEHHEWWEPVRSATEASYRKAGR